MTSQGAEHVIAIDVGSEDNNALLNYGDCISGWRIICNKLNPFSKTMRVSIICVILLLIFDCFLIAFLDS